MAKPKYSASLFLIVLNVYIFFSYITTVSAAAAPDNAVYTSLIQCLQKYTNLQEKISDIVFANTNPSYSSVLRAYIRNARMNTTRTPKPSIIITPKQINHVQAAVICTKQAGYHLKIRSGGHDYEGLSYVSSKPFFILDMFNLRSVQVDIPTQSAWVQVGATLGEVYHGISLKSEVHGYPAGICPTVGVGGHISGAGYGAMVRKFGLTVDNLLDAQMVDVNGKLLNRKTMGEDIFWGISGGGGASFGVVIAYQIKLVPVPASVTFFKIEKTLEENATDMVYHWQLVAPKTDPNLFMRMLVQPIQAAKAKMTIKITIMALYLGNPDTVVALMAKDFAQLGLKKENCLTGSWIQSVLWWANYEKYTTTSPHVLLDRNPNSASFLKRKSDYVQAPINPKGLEMMWKAMMDLGKIGLVFNAYGGKMDQILATASPFPYRKGYLFKVQYSVTWKEAGNVAESNYLGLTRKLYNIMTPYVSKNPRSAYLNYRDLDIGVNSWGPNSFQEGSIYGVKYFGANFQRLVKIKTKVDPTNFFRNEQSIPPTK
ncbi:FAD-binding Berberine family protein [Euphorbia peplus]|nr:FAD-binding Berberine family protein [Euphorbia peplus]